MNASAGAGAGGGADSVQGLLNTQLQGQSPLWVLAAVGLLVGWRVSRRVLPALLARYDGRFQHPPPAAPAQAVQALLQSPAGLQLLTWCWHGARGTAVPWWWPGQRPVLGLALSVAAFGAASNDKPAVSVQALAQALALHLDGSLQLQAASSRWAGLALRLRVKGADLCWWRQRQFADPWDAGYLLKHTDTPAHLARWLPRRASLLLADDLPSAQLRACLQSLHARHAAFVHPVRLLILQAPADVQAMAGAEPITWIGGSGQRPSA
jgi:hypothetical protein